MKNSANERFRHVLIPSLLSGIGTNIYIFTVLILSGASNIIWSPILGTIPFCIGLFFLKRGGEFIKPIFLITILTVSIEIIIHTHFLGWNTGFYYFYILLPAVFLLYSSWKLWMTLFFNLSILSIMSLTFYVYFEAEGIYKTSLKFSNTVYFINASGTGVILIFILNYFSRTVNKKDQELIKSNVELEEKNIEIHAQNEYSKVLLQEIHHRVKNNLQIISSLMSLQSRSTDNKEANIVLNESRRRIEAIALIHQKLYQDDKGNLVNFQSYLEEILTSQKVLTPNIECKLHSDEITVSLNVAVPLGLIVSEIITNSVKHAFSGIINPELQINLSRGSDAFELIISDNGTGLPEGFDIQSSNSLGSEIIVALVAQINGKIECKNNSGVEYTINFQDNIY